MFESDGSGWWLNSIGKSVNPEYFQSFSFIRVSYTNSKFGTNDAVAPLSAFQDLWAGGGSPKGFLMNEIFTVDATRPTGTSQITGAHMWDAMDTYG